jgi:hypothetical protein
MGLEGTFGGDSGGLLSGPGLARVLEEQGTRNENANILNIYLDNTTLAGGAPAPITQNVGSIDIAPTFVFNNNFTRERYGKAAVSDNITLDADRRSLLLDGNQTNEQKVTSMVSALEFDNGLAAVQNMSDADVSATVAPADIDQFERRPESMYLNAAELSGPKRDTLMPAFRGQAEPEFIDAMISRVGGNPTNFATFSDVVAGQTIMQSIAADAISIRMLSSHPNGLSEMAASQTAMQEVASSQTAMQEVLSSPKAIQEAVSSQTARDEVFNSQTAMDELVTSQLGMGEVAASQTAMQEVVSSQTARDTVVGSQTAVQVVAGSEVALDVVAASQTATSSVANSQTAVDAIESVSSSGSNSVPISNNATIYVAELKGGGGGGGDDNTVPFSETGSGQDGGDTTFHQSVAEGGEGGPKNGSASDGGGGVSSPDVPISITTGGGGSGGGGASAPGGGDGGFVKALIVNPNRQSLSLFVGGIGNGGANDGGDGEGGSATIFTPNVFQ